MNLYGASGHAKVIISILESLGENITNIFDDRAPFTLLEHQVKPFEKGDTDYYIISVGNNKTRKKLAEKLDVIHYTKAIHPSAIIDKTVTIDEGSVVMAGSILNIGSRVGKHCIINTAASIDHDCEIADFAHISPNATLCGNVSVDEGAQIGAGAVINPNITIGKWAIVGAGAVIIKDVPDGATVVGNPGRII